MHQIAKNIRNSMSYLQLSERIKDWNVDFRIKEKYYSWSLKSPHPKLTPKFYQLVQQNIITFTLRNFPWILTDFQQYMVPLHQKNMKAVYSTMSLGTSISSQAFNFSMVILVKLTAYFLSNHISVIQVDMTLECDIYRQAMFNILGNNVLMQVFKLIMEGIQIEKKTYQIILKMYKCKKEISKQRDSINIQKNDKENSLQCIPKLQTIKSIGRRNGRHQTYLTSMVDQSERARLEEIKYLLKSNLYVKPNIKKPQHKYTISQLKEKQSQYILNRQYSQVNIRIGHFKNKSLQTPKGKFTIHSNQLSNALSSNYEVHLNEIKKHSIHLSHNKNVLSQIAKPRQLKKLEIKRSQCKIQDKKGVKSVKNWVKIVTEMKEQLFNHKQHRISQDSLMLPLTQEPTSEVEPYGIQRKRQNILVDKSENIHDQTIKFRKLDLMNSPNIVVYEDYPLGVDDSGLLKQDSIKPYIRVNKGQVKNRKERVIDALKSHE